MLACGKIMQFWLVQGEHTPVGQYGESALVVGGTKPAELHRNVASRHHERGARLHQMHRGTLYDACRARNACLRWNHASSSCARAQYGESALVVGGTAPVVY